MTMFGSPLAWFENTGLSSSYVADLAPVIGQWKKEREAIEDGTILPIGEAPDGLTWTGFASVAEDRRGGYLLVFRESEPTSHVGSSAVALRSRKVSNPASRWRGQCNGN